VVSVASFIQGKSIGTPEKGTADWQLRTLASDLLTREKRELYHQSGAMWFHGGSGLSGIVLWDSESISRSVIVN
jgi:hypothetical protein